MPLDPQILSSLGNVQFIDPEISASLDQTEEAIERRKKLLRDKYGWALSAPLMGTREAASARAVRELTDPHDKELLIESVREVSQAQAFAREKEYGEAGFIQPGISEPALIGGRLGMRGQQVLGAFADAGTATAGAAAGFRDWMQGRGDTMEKVRFKRQLEAAKQGEDPSLGEDAPLSLRAAAGAAGMAPDLSAGLLAGVTAGPYAMFAYWTARLFPERNEDYLEMGLDPTFAATAGAVTAAAESAIEMINIDPTGTTKGVIAQPAKGVIRRGISAAIKKYGGKRLVSVAEKSPVVRVAISQALDALERTGVEITEEGIQRGVRDVGQYLAALSGEEIDGPVFSSIAPAMWEEMRAAAPGIAALGGGAGAGMAIGESAMRRREAKRAEIDREILEYADQRKTPSRRTRVEWGLPEEGWESRAQRKEGVQQLASEILAERRIEIATQERVEVPTEVPQGVAGEVAEGAVGIVPPVGEVAVGAEGEVPAGKPIEPRKWDEPGLAPQVAAVKQPEGAITESARLEAQRLAEEARPEDAGFLTGEVGTKPLVGKLGERERRDVIGGGGVVDMSTGDKENDRRVKKAHGIKKLSFREQFGDVVKTSWAYVTRPQVHLPKTERFATANEHFRLLKAVPPAAVDEAIRTVASIVDPLGPMQMELFENAILAQNQLRTIKRNVDLPPEQRQSLRQGFTEERAIAWHKKIFAQVEATLEVKAALEMRGHIAREAVVNLVGKGFLPEGAMKDPETYYHQQVLQMQEAKRQVGTVGGARRKKKSFMMRRVVGRDLSAEEYDYNTSFIESETEWLADAFAELRKAELLDGLVGQYDRTADFRDMAEVQGITLEEAVHRTRGVRFWQPEPGNIFYRAFTIPEKIGEQLQKGILEETNLTPDQVRQVVALGGQHHRIVIPTELADQLDATEQAPQAHWLTAMNKKAMDSWKAFVLLNPKRITSYNVRNFTGDMDPVFAADPRILKAMPRATVELMKYHHGRLQLSPEMRLARDLAVVSAGFFSAEVAESSELTIFRRLKPAEQRKMLRNPAKVYMEIVRPHVEMRENVLRYAAFLTYLDQVRTGELKHYGAAKRITVETLTREMGPEVAAAHMSRELLGDYGNMTEAGEWVRNHLYPFWAFQEINIKRYPRLAINALQAGEGRGRTAVAISAAAAMRIGGLYATFWTWNNVIYPMIFGSNDEDELGSYDRANPHLLLGRNPDGTVRVFRNVGALGDFLEWFGVNEALSLWNEYKAGQVTTTDVAEEMAKAPLEKMVGLLRPDIKGGYEVATGQSLFPNPFSPRSVERDVAVADIFGLGDEWKWMKGLAVGMGHRARPNYWKRWFVGVVDPVHTALGEMYDARRNFLKSKGVSEGGVYPVSEYKQARDAANAEDYDAFVEWKDVFRERHGRRAFKKFKAFRKRLDPIASRLSDRDEWEFENEFLTAEQRGKLQMVRDHAAKLDDRLLQWWIASEQGEPLN